MDIYIDALKGSDPGGDGTLIKPYQTLQYFLMTVALRSGVDYTIYLGEGTYEIANAEAFGRFSNSNIMIIGKQKDTVILQKVGFYINTAGGGSNTFKLTMRKLIYDILPELTSHNLNCFRWQWHFENVVFRTIPNNSYALFLPYAPMVIRNSVKYSLSTAFFRTTDSTIKIYDSIGPFTSGYGTSQVNWDASGNTIQGFSFDEDYKAIGYEKLGVYSGEYAWFDFMIKSIILHNGELKKYYPKVDGITGLVNAVAKMTGEVGPTGIASAKTNYSSDYPWRAFDGEPITYWYDITASASSPTWLQYKFTEPRVINKISLRTAAISGSSMGIKDFTLLASNDGESFVKLFSGVHPNDSQRHEYAFNNNTAYTHYRLQGGESYYGYYMLVTEWEMFEKPTSDVPAYWGVLPSNDLTSDLFIKEGEDSFKLLKRALTALPPIKALDVTLLEDRISRAFATSINLTDYSSLQNIRIEAISNEN